MALWPLVVVLVWVFVGGPLSTFAGKLTEVQQNDNAAFLPQSAESTQALDRLSSFQEQETLPAAVVFVRDEGLTRADVKAVEQYAEQMAGPYVVSVADPVLSEDGAAANVVVQLNATEGEQVEASIQALRDLIADTPAGLRAHVGGQGGILADFVEAFGAIDGLLLLVALSVVLVILLIVYRSPVLPLLVLTSAVLALGVASAVLYGLASKDLITVSGQSQGILFILAVGAATDYSLLIVARFREELRDHESKYEAMRRAYRGAFEPIAASGATVILGLLCLLFSDLASLSGLGPVGAFGIAAAMLSSLTLLPAALVLLGRRAFWPVRPEFGSEHTDTRGLWGRLSRLIGRRARMVWVVTFVLLAAAASMVTQLNEDLVPQSDSFLTDVDSRLAQDVLSEHFSADTSAPVQVVTPAAELPAVLELLTQHQGIATSAGPIPAVFPLPSEQDPRQPKVIDGEAIVLATLAGPADSQESAQTVRDLRVDLNTIDSKILVGGATAINVDIRDTTDHDRRIVIPAILLVILVVLIILLRSVVAPVLLIIANVLSFGATMGVSALVFEHVFNFPATDPSISLIGFVFLVALGIDYSIFLMTRVREESVLQGTRPGILKGLAVTGGVITSAGVVLAATFAALGVIPLLFLAQIGFIVSFGVLLDALIVRSLLVPALSYDVGRAIWWPSRLAREPEKPGAEDEDNGRLVVS